MHKPLLLICLFSGPAFSQSTYTQVTQPYFDSLKQSVEVAEHLRQATLQQQAIDEDKRHNLAEEQLKRQVLNDHVSDYGTAHANEAQWRINQDVRDAIAACHQSHDDCERLDGIMQIISKAFRPDWTQITMQEYIECLYTIAKNAKFAQQARDIALNARK